MGCCAQCSASCAPCNANLGLVWGMVAAGGHSELLRRSSSACDYMGAPVLVHAQSILAVLACQVLLMGAIKA